MSEEETQVTGEQLGQAIEAICMVADEPVPAEVMGDVLGVPADEIDAICVALSEQYVADSRGFVLVKIAGGWRFQSAPECAGFVERFVLDGQTAKLSGAALETLAIIAYKQPLSRAQIAAIRGVNVDGVLKTLQQRGYVTELGHDPGPGQALLFGTTPAFLERLGLSSLADLPPLGDFMPDAELVEVLEQTLRPGGTIDVTKPDAEEPDLQGAPGTDPDVGGVGPLSGNEVDARPPLLANQTNGTAPVSGQATE